MESTSLESVLPAGWPRPKGYSQAWRVPAGRDLVFVSGQIGWNAQEEFVSDDFVDQFEQALANCVAIVVAAGGGATDIVRFTMFCRDKAEYLGRLRDVGAAYQRVIGRHYPAMALVEVADLVEDRARIEIEATAAVEPAANSRGG